MHARIKNLIDDVIELDNGQIFKVQSNYLHRITSWKNGDKIKIGTGYLIHEKKEKKVWVSSFQ